MSYNFCNTPALVLKSEWIPPPFYILYHLHVLDEIRFIYGFTLRMSHIASKPVYPLTFPMIDRGSHNVVEVGTLIDWHIVSRIKPRQPDRDANLCFNWVRENITEWVTDERYTVSKHRILILLDDYNTIYFSRFQSCFLVYFN